MVVSLVKLQADLKLQTNEQNPSIGARGLWTLEDMEVGRCGHRWGLANGGLLITLDCDMDLWSFI